MAPLTITDHLVALHKSNAAAAGSATFATMPFEPNDFTRRKFPDTSAEEVSALVEKPVHQLGWNVFMT